MVVLVSQQYIDQWKTWELRNSSQFIGKDLLYDRGLYCKAVEKSTYSLADDVKITVSLWGEK